MEFYAQLRGQAQTLVIHLVAETESVIRIVGCDRDRPCTKFFDRRVGSDEKPFVGEKRLELPMPVSPDVLKVEIIDLDTGDSEHLKVTNLELKPVKTIPLWIGKRTRDFMDFAMEFALQAGYCPVGGYSSDDERFHILYNDVIRNKKTHEIMFTPARVSRVSGIMEICRKKFKHYSVPMRLLIMLHERMHYEQNTGYEIEADLNALRVYLSYGFPATEAIYATANIFYDSPEMIERVREITRFILDFQKPMHTHTQVHQ